MVIAEVEFGESIAEGSVRRCGLVHVASLLDWPMAMGSCLKVISEAQYVYKIWLKSIYFEAG
jgi:hypothetical protein